MTRSRGINYNGKESCYEAAQRFYLDSSGFLRDPRDYRFGSWLWNFTESLVRPGGNDRFSVEDRNHRFRQYRQHAGNPVDQVRSSRVVLFTASGTTQIAGRRP